MKRKGLSKKIRFQVLRRDNFTCQYCGRKAPAVCLEIDHIKSVALDGDNDIDNLITACHDCNIGKGIMSAELEKKLAVSDSCRAIIGALTEEERGEVALGAAIFGINYIDPRSLACILYNLGYSDGGWGKKYGHTFSFDDEDDIEE